MTPWLLPTAAGALWAGMLLHRQVAGGSLIAVWVVGVGLVAAALFTAARRPPDDGVLRQSGLAPGLREPAEVVAPAPLVRTGSWVAAPILAVGLFLVGAAWAQSRSDGVDHGAVARLAPGRVSVEGSLRTDPESTDFGWSATLRVARVEVDGGTTSLVGAVWVSGDGDLPSALRGDRVRVEGSLEIPDDAGFAGFLSDRGLAATLRADSLARLGPPGDPVMSLASGTRALFRRSIYALFPPKWAGLLMGLALGDTSGIPDSMTRDFRATGLTHLLAVSGQNVAMVLVPIVALASLLGLGRWSRFGLCAGTVVFFVLLTGAEPSVLRAGVMATIALTGTVAGRPRAAWPVFGAALLCLLIADPFLATSVGLQLSAAATCGMLALAGPLSSRFTLLPEPVALAVGTTLAAQIGSSPVLLAYFHWVPGATLFANLIAFPAVSPAMLFGLAAAATGAVIPPLGWVLARLAIGPMWWLTVVADRLASAPLPAMTSRGGLVPIVLGTVVFVAVVWLVRGSSPKRVFLVAGIVLSVPGCVVLSAARAGPPEHLTVHFLDVGQGDAALIVTPGGATILVDAGPDPNEVANRLAALGIRRIDVAVATHPHADHIEGFPEVFARYQVGMVVEPGCDEPSPSYTAFLQSVRDEDLAVEHPVAGETITAGDATLRVLAPPACYHDTHSDPNNDSIVLRLEHPDGTVLFPGDAEVESQEAMMDSGMDLHADVLKVPHHGGDTSADGFFDAVAAEVAVVSVGQPNDYGHPVPGVLDAIEASGSSVVRTDEVGEVIVTLAGRQAAVESVP